MSDRDILLSLCASLTLADHMGDAAGDVIEALRQAGVEVPYGEEWPVDVQKALGKLGVKSLYGTEIGGGDE